MLITNLRPSPILAIHIENYFQNNQLTHHIKLVICSFNNLFTYRFMYKKLYRKIRYSLSVISNTQELMILSEK